MSNTPRDAFYITREALDEIHAVLADNESTLGVAASKALKKLRTAERIVGGGQLYDGPDA